MTSAILQSAATTGNGATFQPGNNRHIVFYLRGNGGVTAGAVTLEEDMDGTATAWTQITAPITLTVGTNAVQAFRAPVGAYGTVRARINTNVTGGTVTVTALAV